jgi:hypothetical protein
MVPATRAHINYYQRTMTETSARTDDMPPYEVVDVHYADVPGGHEHVAYVETSDPDGGETRWTQAEILAAVRQGERFVLTQGGVVTDTTLEVATCPACPQPTLRLPSSTA